MMTTVLQDLRFALRQLRRAPGFAAGVIVVLALGIGSNAAMFTLLEGTLFRPLPYQQAGDLLRLTVIDAAGKAAWLRLADVGVWRERSRTMQQIAYYESGRAYLSADVHQQSTGQKVATVNASSNLFSTLGVHPVLGRTFSADEQQPGREHVLVLSDMVWRSQFHADPAVLGRVVNVDDAPVTIIGVMPPSFLFPADQPANQVWRPAGLQANSFERGPDAPTFTVVSRRIPGRSIAEITAELGGIQKQLVPLYQSSVDLAYAPARVVAADYRQSLSAADQRTALLALLGAVVALWLIACANVAGLMLARAAARRREMAVRAALGASGWRLIRQTLVESLLLSLIGEALGLALSQATLQLFRHALTTQLSAYLTLRVDLRVLMALTLLSLLSALFFGVVPAYLAARLPVEQALRQDGAQMGTGRSQHRLQRILVVTELALTLTLLVSCGLLLRTVFALHHVPLGFRTEHVFDIEPHLPAYKYRKLDPNAIVYKPLIERMSALPGVQAVAITTIAPLGKGFNVAFSRDTGKGGNSDSGRRIVARLRASGPELQKVLGFTMARGRYFNAEDTPDAPLVAVVNQAFAKAYEPGSGDIAKFMMGGSEGARRFKIVGVVQDFHQAGIADPAEPEIDLDAAQMKPSDPFYQPTLGIHAELLLRSSRSAVDLEPELEEVLRTANPDLADSSIRTMDQIVEDAMGSQLLVAHLLETLGGLALVIAVAGLYSLLAYLVTLRTRELGLRLALGAQRADIISLVLRGAVALLLTGAALGIAFSLVSAHVLSRFLFGVKQYDALTLVSASTLLLVAGAIAAWLPAHRAARVEPMQALRTE